jgi:Mn2+/Fe2+ NRAMP family transporter
MGSLVNQRVTSACAVCVVTLIVGLNAFLIAQVLSGS